MDHGQVNMDLETHIQSLVDLYPDNGTWRNGSWSEFYNGLPTHQLDVPQSNYLADDFLSVPGDGSSASDFSEHTQTFSSNHLFSSDASFSTTSGLSDDQLQDGLTLQEAKEGDDQWTTPHISQESDFQLQLVGDEPSLEVLEFDEQNVPFSPVFNDNGIGEPVLPSGSQPATPSRVRSPFDSAKRQRVAEIRRKGACVRCQLRKVECDIQRPCKRCAKYLRQVYPTHSRKNGNYPQICVNHRLSDIRFPSNFKNIIWLHDFDRGELPRDNMYFVGPKYLVTVTFTEDGLPPSLQLILQAFTVNDAMGNMLNLSWTDPSGQFSLPRDSVPSGDDFVRWSSEKMALEGTSTFKNALGSFLNAYAHSPAPLPKKELTLMAHKIGCWYRIWQSPLYAPTGLEFPARRLLGMASLELKNIATDALVSLERDILLELDALKGGLKEDVKIPIWACFWQLILIYRDLNKFYTFIVQRQTSFGATQDVFAVSRATRTVLERLIHLLIINYAAHFPKLPFLNREERIQDPFQGDAHLEEEFQNVCHQRKVDLFRTPFETSDSFLKDFIISHEIALDSKRTRKRT